MRTSIARFVKDESGATAIEYGLIAAGIAVAVLTMMSTIGDGFQALATSLVTKLKVVE
ncbi:MAG TPA: Flp family type IVb pilin [Methyloceanibacter sp.]|nr:Flp family type IVb pilin [Methyloceanibacter sp.]